MEKSFEDIAIRYTNGENKFIRAVMDQFEFSESDSIKILEVFKKLKIVKIDIGVGQFNLSHGAYWDKNIMKNAISNYDKIVKSGKNKKKG